MAISRNRSNNGNYTIVNKEVSSYRPLLRQTFVCSAVWSCYFISGLSYGTPTVMIPQIMKDNSTLTISEEMDSILKSLFGYATIPWLCFLTFLAIVLGRRKPFFLVSLTMIAGFCISYFSTSDKQILISQIMQCSSQAFTCCITVIIITEYASPKYRGVFLTASTGTAFWGIWVANALGTFLPWRCIPILGVICTLFTLPFIFYPESPSWLASKGRYDECRKAHRWLRGVTEDSEKELEYLIKSQEEHRNSKRKWNFRYLKSTLICPGFYKPIMLTTFLSCLYHFSGKVVYIMYVLDIVKRITESEHMAYMSMLGLDAVTILATYAGSAMSKFVFRRTLLFTTAPIAVILLFIISLYLYLIKISVIIENNFISLSLLALLNIFISCGLLVLQQILCGELVSLKYRSISILIVSIIFNLVYSVVLQPTPYIFKHWGLHGAFFIYGVMSSVFTFLCYKYLPETKDKTMQEIEEYFENKSEAVKSLLSK